MSYNIKLRNRAFFLSMDKKSEALAAVKALRGQETCHDSGGSHFSWLDDSYLKATNLEGALWCWGYVSRVNNNGDIISLSYEREKAGDEGYLFNAIAPFVRVGSYLVFYGEDGETWRWYFDGQKCRKQVGTLVFTDPGADIP